MRIAQVVPSLAEESGGPAVSVLRLSRELARLGHEVTLFTLAPAPEPEAAGLSVRAFPPAPPRRLGRSPGLKAALSGWRGDIIHAHCLWMSPLGYAASAARTNRIPLAISPRGMLAPWALARSPLRKRLARLAVHRGAFETAAGWHATSPAEADDIRRERRGAFTCIAPNGVDEVRDDPAAWFAEAPELRGRRVLLFYSRFHSKKRIIELIEDFAALASEHPEWHLLVAGIPEEYSAEQLRERARAHGIAARCTVLPGVGKSKPYALAELFVLPSHDENFGQVVAEALSAGVPVVATTGTPWQGLDDADAGGCVPLPMVRAELSRLMIKPAAELRAMGARGREWVLREFSWSATAERLVEFYGELLARS